MITVNLHGPFRAAHPGPITVAATTVAEAIEAVTRQLPGFKPDPVHGMKRAVVVGYDTVEDLYRNVEDDLTIDLVPAVLFSGGPKTQMIIGATLILIGVFMGPGTGPIAAMFIATGANLMIGGVMQLLAPQQKLSKEEEIRSRYLGTPPNTVGIGTRIPILYGKDLVQGHILSSDVDAEEIT